MPPEPVARVSMKKTTFAVVALAISLAACQSAPASAPASAPPSPTGPSSATATDPAMSPVATPAASAIPSAFRVTLAPEPFLEPADGPQDSAYLLPAAGTRAADGSLALVVIFFPVQNGTPLLRAVTSTDDGATWTVGGANLLEGLDIGDPDPGPIPGGLLQHADGSWQLYGWAADDAAGSTFSSWRASAADFEGPWVLDRYPILEPGAAGSWDSLMAAAASVQLGADGRYLLWYEGEAPGSGLRGDIGLARSDDGLAWLKAPEPVIPHGICGGGTELAVEQPQVEHLGDGFVAFFVGGSGTTGGRAEIYAATSPDGVSWSCDSQAPVFRDSEIPNSQGIHTMASTPLGDGRIGLVFESLGDGSSTLFLATVELDQP